MYRQIGILTGGGDAPGLNAVIRAVVRTAIGEFGMRRRPCSASTDISRMPMMKCLGLSGLPVFQGLVV